MVKSAVTLGRWFLENNFQVDHIKSVLKGFDKLLAHGRCTLKCNDSSALQERRGTTAAVETAQLVPHQPQQRSEASGLTVILLWREGRRTSSFFCVFCTQMCESIWMHQLLPIVWRAKSGWDIPFSFMVSLPNNWLLFAPLFEKVKLSSHIA